MNKEVTIVTGLWNLGRGEIDDSFKRPYDNYLEKFAELLKTDANMYIFVAPEDEDFIWQHRDTHNTVVKTRSLEELKAWFEFSELTNQIRQQESWKSQAGWLPSSPQSTLEMYNPVVMSKMFLLNDVTFYNPFESEYFFWIDAGIANTVHPGYFYKDKVFDNLPTFCRAHKNFIYLSYPYDGGTEIHGFPREAIAKYCKVDYVNYVCRGGFFGGRKDHINNISNSYYGILTTTLKEGLMGTEESIFTILAHTIPDIIHRFEIEGNGLIWPFFEALKKYKPQNEIKEVALYVLTYNSPEQFEGLCKSFIQYDSDFLTQTKKYLLNNSTDPTVAEQYAALCETYDFEEIKKDNIGICGGRQFIAEHFVETSHSFYIFYEDDMYFYNEADLSCRNGFQRKVKNLFRKALEIVKVEKFDYLKFNFTEFFGDNSTQWAWYNVPQAIREQYWPNNKTLPIQGQSRNAPKAQYGAIKSFEQLPYTSGEVYYCNWPQIVSREGNYKMFIETKWQYPYEQTWMSHMFQELKKGNLRFGLLLATPTEHNRFDHYGPGERKEH